MRDNGGGCGIDGDGGGSGENPSGILGKVERAAGAPITLNGLGALMLTTSCAEMLPNLATSAKVRDFGSMPGDSSLLATLSASLANHGGSEIEPLT